MMNKDKENVVQSLLQILNTAAKEHDIHLSSDEDMLLKIDDVVVARMYYDATEKRYVVTEQEASHE